MRDGVRAGGPIANRPTRDAGGAAETFEDSATCCRLRTGAGVVVHLPARKVPWLRRLVEGVRHE